MPTVIQTTIGDSSPAENFTVTREGGTVVNLTGATVNFRIQDPITGVVTNPNTSLCAIVDAVNGICQYSWTNGGTDCPDVGIYNAYLVITFSNGTKETYPFLVEAAPTA